MCADETCTGYKSAGERAGYMHVFFVSGRFRDGFVCVCLSEADAGERDASQSGA